MSTLTKYVRNGPVEGGDSTPRRVLGIFVWWRTWAVLAFLSVLFIILYAVTPPSTDPRLWGFLLGWLAAGASLRVIDA